MLLIAIDAASIACSWIAVVEMLIIEQLSNNRIQSNKSDKMQFNFTNHQSDIEFLNLLKA